MDGIAAIRAQRKSRALRPTPRSPVRPQASLVSSGGAVDGAALLERLVASLMHGADLRLMECLRLRVQDIDLSRNEITVRDGKGAKDRITMLPESLKTSLQEHLKKVKTIHERDLAEGWGRVKMPMALDRKYPNAPAEWRRQWVFPQENRWTNPQTREQGRHHTDESLVQNAERDAVVKAGLEVVEVKLKPCPAWSDSTTLRLPPASEKVAKPASSGSTAI